MKRISILMFIFLLSLVFASCGDNDEISGVETRQQNTSTSESPAISFLVDELEFSSLTEFLEAHRSTANGRAFGESSQLAESVNFTDLENLYLPVGIPDEYRLFMILVNERFVSLWYLPEEHLTSEETIRSATGNRQHFLFSFTRGHIERFGPPKDAMLQQLRISESDLIDGRYYFNGRNFFMWASDNEQMFLYTPMPTTDSQGNLRIGTNSTGFTTFNLDEPPPFTQIRTVDLTNPVEVEELLQEQVSTMHQLSFRLDRYTEVVDWGSIEPIDILSNTNILDFLQANHGSFSEGDPSREGYEFIGWYLNPAFVTPLTESTRMPARNTTLYARWLPPTITITFNTGNNGAFLNNETVVTLESLSGERVPWVRAVTPNDGWYFEGWLRDGTSDILSMEQVLSLALTQDTIFTAQYTSLQPPTHTITFTPGTHGTFADGQSTITQEILPGGNIVYVPQVQPGDGWEFAGWRQGNDGDVLTAEQVMALSITQNTTFIAQFTSMPTQSQPQTIIVHQIPTNWGDNPPRQPVYIEQQVAVGGEGVQLHHGSRLPQEGDGAGLLFYDFVGWSMDRPDRGYFTATTPSGRPYMVPNAVFTLLCDEGLDGTIILFANFAHRPLGHGFSIGLDTHHDTRDFSTFDEIMSPTEYIEIFIQPAWDDAHVFSTSHQRFEGGRWVVMPAYAVPVIPTFGQHQTQPANTPNKITANFPVGMLQHGDRIGITLTDVNGFGQFTVYWEVYLSESEFVRRVVDVVFVGGDDR